MHPRDPRKGSSYCSIWFVQMQLVFLTMRVHLFPFRTQKLSSPVPTILVWRRTGKIGQRQHKGFGESQTLCFMPP